MENRNLFIEHCIKHDHVVSNTYFDKPDRKLKSYRAPGIEGTPTVRIQGK